MWLRFVWYMFGSLTEPSTLSYFEWRSTHEDGMELARGCMPMPWPDTRHTCNIFHFHGTGFYTRIQLRGDPNDETENWHTILYHTIYACKRTKIGPSTVAMAFFSESNQPASQPKLSRAHTTNEFLNLYGIHTQKRTRKSNKKNAKR